MLIENYKVIDINHDAAKDEFYTTIVIRKSTTGKQDEYIRGGRLQNTRDQIDKFLNTASKKPVLKKAWLRGRYNSSGYEQVNVIVYNKITNYVVVSKEGDSKQINIALSNQNYGDRNKLYLDCKENAAIISTLKKKEEEKRKIEKETSCSSGKLIPLTLEHFV